MVEANQSNCNILKKSDEFSILVLLEEAIKQFEDSENCNLSKFNTRTTKGGKKKKKKKKLDAI